MGGSSDRASGLRLEMHLSKGIEAVAGITTIGGR